MAIDNKNILSWEELVVERGKMNSKAVIYKRMTENRKEVAAVIFGKDNIWEWMILSDASEVSSGESDTTELAKFMVDLNLSDFISERNTISNIFKL
jgi:hypothetical protein